MSTKKKLGTLFAVFACMMMTLAVVMTPAQAADPENGYVYLLNDGRTSVNATTQFQFYVEVPAALGLDADYWNLTVYADPVRATATNATYHIHIYIYDGATNITKVATMAAKNDVNVYGNVSFAAADYAAVVTGEAVLYLELQNSTHAVLDHYDGTITIVDAEYAANMINILMMIIPLIVIIVLIGWMTNMFEEIGKAFKK